MNKNKTEPDNLAAAKGSSKGEINLQWDPVENAASYIIEYSNWSGISSGAKWKILDIVSDSRYTVRNLKSNRNYLFRIATADEGGMMKRSVNVSKKAP